LALLSDIVIISYEWTDYRDIVFPFLVNQVLAVSAIADTKLAAVVTAVDLAPFNNRGPKNFHSASITQHRIFESYHCQSSFLKTLNQE
jgi:hypothetical protein